MNPKIDDICWDAAIVGAGPAGSVAAAILCARGWRVLLIDKSHWPRNKACGGCLSAAAVDGLNESGLGAALREAELIERATWCVGNQKLHIVAPGGAAILRSDLDAALVSAVVERGCTFLHGAAAALLQATADADFRLLRLQIGEQTRTVRAAVVLACDGIGGTLLANEPWARWSIQPGAWIGAATTLESWSGDLEPETIRMHVGYGGYVGLVRVPGRVHLAAALDPAMCRDAGGPGRMVDGILASCGQSEWNGLEDAKFFGAGALTRRREQLGGHRVLAVGDACGYVEPFTGEGMAWAIAGAREVTKLLPNPGENWRADLPEQWRRRHVEMVGRRQRWCRGLGPIMHRPAWAAVAVAIGRALPAVGDFAASCVSQARRPRTQRSFG